MQGQLQNVNYIYPVFVSEKIFEGVTANAQQLNYY